MLDEIPVVDVGLARSNVLPYFESREAVLLELLDDFLGRRFAELGSKFRRRPASYCLCREARAGCAAGGSD